MHVPARAPSVVRLPTAAAHGELARQAANGTAVPRTPDMRTLDELSRAGLLGQEAAPPGAGPSPTTTHEPGGDTVRQLLHPSFLVFERMYRRLPDQGMFSPLLDPDRPFQFTLGSFTVPKNTELWLSDYEFGVLLLDGVNPGDFRLAEDGRFSGVLGFDLSVNAYRPGDVQYQLDPAPIPPGRPQFNPQPGTQRATASQFDEAAAASFAAQTTASTSLLPVRRAVQGPDNRNPWTWIVTEGQVVALECAVFRPILSPIAAIFGRAAGHRLNKPLSQAIVQRLRPR